LAFRVLKPSLVVVCMALLLAAAASAGARTHSSRVFYLAVKRGECGIATASAKTVLLVPCSDARHTVEIYAIRHGGWGRGTEPPTQSIAVTARQICLAAYRRVTGRPLPKGYGYSWSAPDPGQEEARYGDKLICGLTRWPKSDQPLGSGWHVH
jgi:hypothetical protein